MKSYLIPINIGLWNYFEKIKNSIDETFLYVDGMEKGDRVLLYITDKGLKDSNEYKKVPGVYAIGKIKTGKKKMNNPNDVNFGQDVIDVHIEYYNFKKPLGNFGCKPSFPRPKLIDHKNNSLFDSAMQQVKENSENNNSI